MSYSTSKLYPTSTSASTSTSLCMFILLIPQILTTSTAAFVASSSKLSFRVPVSVPVPVSVSVPTSFTSSVLPPVPVPLSLSQNNNRNTILFSSPDAAEPSMPSPQNFREAEILGLKFMQEGEHEQALEVFKKGMKLPGSKKDIIRKANIAGPSPVGGAAGGTEGRVVLTLDEFELQAAHYNIACACARLGKVAEACQNLEQAFKSGFDNYDTVCADPDLSEVHDSQEFENLMEKWNPKKGFFGFFK